MTTRKSGMAEEERRHRAYRETYGRGGGETFADGDYPQSYGSPGAMDWRKALRAYVDGHDRGWETERKEAAAAKGSGPEGDPRRPGELAVRAEEGAGREPSGRAPAGEATARTDEGTRFGVPVPDRDELRFHRNASVWRDALPPARRMPRHTDRRLDTAPGRGGQA